MTSAAARAAADELSKIADDLDAPLSWRAWPPRPTGAVLLARGRRPAALAALRRCVDGVAGARGAVRSGAGAGADRARLPGSSATRTAREMELDAARWAFGQLGAAPDLARAEALSPDEQPPSRPAG